MPPSWAELVWGGLAPAGIAALVLTLLRRPACGEAGERYAPAVSLAIGWLVAYEGLSLGPWSPSSHWHWLPYVIAVAAVSTPVWHARGVSCAERTGLTGLGVLAAISVLVPGWDDMATSRPLLIALWGGLSLAICVGFPPLMSQRPAWLVPASLAATMFCATILLVLSGNLRFSVAMGAGLAAWLGMIAAAAAQRRSDDLQLAVPVWTLLTCGLLLLGQVNSFSEVPWISYLIIPAAPLGYSLLLLGPLTTGTGWRRALVIVFPLLVQLGTIVVAWSSDSGGDAW